MFGEHALGVKAIGSQGTLQVGTSSFAGLSLQVSVAVGVLEATQSMSFAFTMTLLVF